jgi:hypothetical protein
MVCDNCGNSGCSKKTPGHRQNSGSCPFRECSNCKEVGHSACECRPLTIMVCAHCGYETHRTGSGNCPNHCAMCKRPGHGQKSGSCPFRESSKCKQVGHSAREYRKKNVRSIENDADLDGQLETMHDANDKDADTCTMIDPMSVDGQLES